MTEEKGQAREIVTCMNSIDEKPRNEKEKYVYYMRTGKLWSCLKKKKYMKDYIVYFSLHLYIDITLTTLTQNSVQPAVKIVPLLRLILSGVCLRHVGLVRVCVCVYADTNMSICMCIYQSSSVKGSSGDFSDIMKSGSVLP